MTTKPHSPALPLDPRAIVACMAAALLVLPLTALAVIGWRPLHALDHDLTRAFNAAALEHRVLLRPLQATSFVFHAWVFRLAVAALFAWLLYRGARRLAAWAAVTIVASGLLGLALKVGVDRPRPELEQPIAHAPGGSFPSGHAMTAATGSLILVLVLAPLLKAGLRALFWTLAVVITLAAGACRVALGVHFVSDVVAGWLLGLAVVAATAAVYHRKAGSIGPT